MNKRQRRIHLATMVQAAAERNPAGPITVDQPLSVRPDLGTRFTVADLAAVVEMLRAKLHACDIRAGERVAVYKTNNADILAITCALAGLGAIPVLISPAVPGPIAAQLVQRAQPRHILTDAGKIACGDVDPDGYRAVTPSVMLTSGSVADLRSLDRLVAEAAPPAPEIDNNGPCIITHTSGTTGVPKLVEQSARGLAAHIRIQRRIAGLFQIREPWALCVSFVHARTYSALAVGLLRRIPFAFLADHDTATVRRVFREFRPGLVETHPNTFVQWEPLAEDPDRPLSNVRYYISTFDAIHPRTVRILLGASDRRAAIYFQAYGQTETGPVTVRVYTRRGARRAQSRCVGYGIPGLTRVRLRNGRRAPSHIEVRSKGRGLTYVGEDGRFAGQLDGTWWNMGDLGYRGRWQCVHLLDREIDHMDGLDSVLEAEDALMTLVPELTEVVLVEDAEGGIRPVVCTRDDRPLNLDTWAAACAKLPAMLAPLHTTWDRLPQTATFKVKRVELQRLVQDGRLPALAAER
ncbi:AMP-binding protein [Nocardia sp. NPDC059239]|uniref:AMP-binding protein n=1 Tax=unclassified Nocardia TaxID=2637762 RepID=UPI0036C12C0A